MEEIAKLVDRYGMAVAIVIVCIVQQTRMFNLLVNGGT